jgi:hypothetical protein
VRGTGEIGVASWALAAALTLGLLATAADASAQVVIQATRVTTPIRIDGRLDDAAYRDVAPLTKFIQQEPEEGAAVTERTEAWVLFDDDNVYIACRCYDANPQSIQSKDMRRDSANQRFNDTFGVMLDTFHDRRNGFIFSITPSGGFTDALVTDERGFNPDWTPSGTTQRHVSRTGGSPRWRSPSSRCALHRATCRPGASICAA